jgi:hypothetical protein
MMFKTSRPKFTLLSASLTLVYGSFISIIAATNSGDDVVQQTSALEANESSSMNITIDNAPRDKVFGDVAVSTVLTRSIIDDCSGDVGMTIASALKGAIK